MQTKCAVGANYAPFIGIWFRLCTQCVTMNSMRAGRGKTRSDYRILVGKFLEKLSLEAPWVGCWSNFWLLKDFLSTVVIIQSI